MDPHNYSRKPVPSLRRDFPLLDHLNLLPPLNVLAKPILQASSASSSIRPSWPHGIVLAEAGYGNSAGISVGLRQRGRRWAVGVQPAQNVYPADVTLYLPAILRWGAPPGMQMPLCRACRSCR